jgi:hypothetical protein
VGGSLLQIQDRKSKIKHVRHSCMNWYTATLPLLSLTEDLLPYLSHSHHWKFSVSSGCLFPPLVLLCQLSKMLPRKTEGPIQRYLLQSFQSKGIKTCHRKLQGCYLSLIPWGSSCATNMLNCLKNKASFCCISCMDEIISLILNCKTQHKRYFYRQHQNLGRIHM